MPCDSKMRAASAQAERDRQLKALESRLKAKTASIVKLGSKISIDGWAERGGWCDACAIRQMRQSSDFQIRHMIAHAVPAAGGLTFGHGH